MASEKDIIKIQAEFVERIKQRSSEVEAARHFLEDTFGNLERALQKINNIKTNDPTVLALQKVRKSTDSFQRVLEKHDQDVATIDALTGARRKQRFKHPALTNKIVKDVEEGLLKEVQEQKEKVADAKIRYLQKDEIKPDGSKVVHQYFGYGKGGQQGGAFFDWMWDNSVHGLFSIVKHYKKKKTRYKPIDWDDLAVVLRTLNFRPEEVLEYSIGKIQTKERYLEHRLYRNIEARNASGLEDFIDIYKKFLKTKKPFKVFFHSKALANWCAMEDIFFKSEENCRVNKDLMVQAYNKKYPQDKISDKKKK